MSLLSLLKHRCTIMRPVEVADEGSFSYDWQPVAANIACFLNLGLIRSGRDSMWMDGAGRPSDRTGTVFFGPKTSIQSGDRILMTTGPAGMFLVEGALDEIWTPNSKGAHHIEIGVIEVATPIYRPDYSNG